ncbi:hypothetical protein [Entomospira culicis]|uniref:Uncharacterized protein n=1 Tax=Entomospira culicis TaxID=2719989 RepID=A0A968KW66_9SPIO|nr:hypothetical protein [Entomospira culicis]NIZ18642.1 hypothetical protein [Entomospira culicis]NIZ68857.1 hypothetical protein [Entomospira culicis]WDI37451.1 hypothetical protein PVA46_01290 [Entomospira culicis]WDI39079.1 hypothetical protein PVA47_01295 [Entomospira culicis]
MRVSLSVTLEKGENNEQLISAHFDVDDNIVNLDKETYHMLLSAVTSQMLMLKAAETQAIVVDSLKESLQNGINGIIVAFEKMAQAVPQERFDAAIAAAHARMREERTPPEA